MNRIESRSIIENINFFLSFFFISFVFQKHCEYDVALSKYKIAAQLIPESSALWNNVGMCFYGKQKFVAVSNYYYILLPLLIYRKLL